MTLGRISGTIKLSTAWTVQIQGSADGSPVTATIAAGTYGMGCDLAANGEFVTVVKAAFNAASASAWNITHSLGEGGTNKITISETSFSVTWSATTYGPNVRDIFGFAGNISGASTSSTGTKQVRFCWLADAPWKTPHGKNEAGWYLTDARETVSPAGHVVGFVGNTQRRNRIEYNGVAEAHCRIASESTTNESFERFWLDAIVGQGPGSVVCGPIYWYTDADSSSTGAFSYSVVGDALRQFPGQLMVDGYTGFYSIGFDVVEVPS